MSCAEWNDSWIAELYGEIEPADESALRRHLASCSECAARFDELRRTHALLQDALPAVPPAPRVVVLETPSAARLSWAFVAGGIAAGIVLGLGLWAIRPDGASAPTSSMTPATTQARDEALAQRLAALDARVGRIESAPRPAGLTPAELHDELARLERRLDRERSHEIDYILQSITASELRTGTWIEGTRNALDLLAQDRNPGLRDQ
jgi:hypothetical protein